MQQTQFIINGYHTLPAPFNHWSANDAVSTVSCWGSFSGGPEGKREIYNVFDVPHTSLFGVDQKPAFMMFCDQNYSERAEHHFVDAFDFIVDDHDPDKPLEGKCIYLNQVCRLDIPPLDGRATCIHQLQTILQRPDWEEKRHNTTQRCRIHRCLQWAHETHSAEGSNL